MRTETNNKNAYTERQLVIFKVADEEFGVDIDKVKEIIKIEKTTKIPNAEEYVKGIINLRGNIIVIINLAQKLGLTIKEENKDTRIIVVETTKTNIGMIVDSCNEVLRMPTNQIKNSPTLSNTKIEKEYIEGVGIIKERLIIILNLAKILGEQELAQIAQLQEQHQQ